MRARSITSLLTRQWMFFATCVGLLFAAAGLLLLFLLEDSFIDRQLQAAARTVASASPGLTRLPVEYSVYPIAEVPPDIHARLRSARAGEPFEMRRADRRHVHVLLVDTPRSGRLAVVYDVTDQLTVSPRLGSGLILVLGLTLATLLAAAALARAFVARVTRQAEQLAHSIRGSPDPKSLRELARDQQVLEFQHLLGLHADIWEAQLSAVEDERQTLAYLGHELRTPLQSAQTSLALLSRQRSDAAAFDRLERAVSRLTRASGAALWLATERQPDLSVSTPLLPIIHRVAAELSPLAERAGQVIEIDVPATASFHGPVEISETILANLLLNAIQHGSPGSIIVRAEADALVITNPDLHGSPSGGFGFGLEIVRRLAERIGWTVQVSTLAGSASTRCTWIPVADEP